jgi:tripartite-type tricarboxylate transporter receptor subunit TctC
VVENRAGAGGTVGTAAAAQSTDGHTLLMVSIAHALNPALYPRLPYDSVADFAPVAPVAVVPNLLAVPAARPWRTQADLVSGRLDAMFDSVTSASPHIASGRLRALAVTTGRRIAAFPDLPTVAEAGVPGYVVDPWFAMLAPRSLPAEARGRVGGVVGRALQDPAVRERFAAIGAEPMEGDAASLGRLIADETAKWGDLVRRLGIQPD